MADQTILNPNQLDFGDPNNPLGFQQAAGQPAPGAPAGNWWDAGRPTYQSTTNADGTLKAPFSGSTSAVAGDLQNNYLANVNNIATGQDFTSARNATNDLSGLANTQGMTQHASYLTDAQLAQEAASRDNLWDSLGGQNAQAFDQMAATGGLDGGSRERIATSGARNAAIEQQKLARQGDLSRLGILSDDEKMKIGLKQQLPSMYLGLDQHNTDVQAKNAQIGLDKANLWSAAATKDADRKAGMDQFNIGNAINDTNSKNKWDYNMWDYNNKGIAAGKTADYEQKVAERQRENDPIFQAKKAVSSYGGPLATAVTGGNNIMFGATANALGKKKYF